MDLIGSLTDVNNVRGITLNSQQIDLFNIIEQAQSREEAVKKVYEYLDGILQANKMSKEMNLQRLNTAQKIKRVVDEKVISVPNKDEFLKFLLGNAMQIRANWDQKESLEKLFEGKDIDTTYIDTILDMKKYFAHQTHGILTFLVDKDGQTINPDSEVIEVDKQKTYQKVEALYEYIVGNLENGDNRFNRLTLDGQGKFGTVAGVMQTEKEAQAKPNDYNLQPLIQGYEFARNHNMDIRINALVFFKDFPDRLIGESADAYKTALESYGKAISFVANEYAAKGVPTTIDMFNEFVDYNAPFSERTNNWMSKLSVEDLCKIALTLKQEMPDVDFGYNDWNFENPDKRKTIFEVIRKIQEFERQNNCKIIDHIGTQCHTSINDIKGLRKSIEELQQFGLPVDITELDISKGLNGVDYERATQEELRAIRKYEQKLQNDMMKMLSDFVRDGKIRGITSWSITDELCCDFCDGKQASVTGMSFDNKTGFTFSGKDMDKEIEMTLEEMQLIQEHILRIRESKKQEINQNPTQDFCFHTHTQRCGHGAKDTGDEEWVEHAIKGGKQISDEVLDLYAESIISAMDKDLPDVIAHPDLFMQARDSFGAKEEEITRAICRKAIEKGIPLEINFGKIASKVESKMPLDELKKRIPYPSPEFWKIVAEETRIAKENGQDLFVIYGKDAHSPQQLSTEKDYEIARAIIGEQILEQLHIVTEHKELEESTKKQTKTKSIQGLVQESIEGVPDLTILDDIEQAQARQQRTIIEQREGQNYSQNIGD